MNYGQHETGPRRFPVEAFPQLAYNAILEVQSNTQTPFPLVASSLLGALSLAIQSKVDVRRSDGLTGPCSLFILTIAESGERKTTVDKLFTKPIRDFEASQATATKPILEKYRAEKSAWMEKRKGILLAIRASSKKGASPDESDLERELSELLASEPMEPKIPQLILADATPESIAYHLYKIWPSAGIVSDEGGLVFDSRATRNLGMFNKLWDGDSIHVSRKTAESFIVHGARFSFVMMVQPKPFGKFLEKQGRLARENGFVARLLVSYPASTQGTRFINESNPSWQSLSAFQNRLTEILNSTAPEALQSDSGRITLKFSPDAQASWTSFHNLVEGDLTWGGYLADVRDGASKIADNLARIAALFHYFEGNRGEISLDTMNRAAAVSDWYMHEFKRLFAAEPEIPIEVADANELERWFINLCQRLPGGTKMKKNFIAQHGPNQLRSNRIRREAALAVLAMSKKIWFELQGRTQWVVLNPAFFPMYPSPPMPYRPQY